MVEAHRLAAGLELGAVHGLEDARAHQGADDLARDVGADLSGADLDPEADGDLALILGSDPVALGALLDVALKVRGDLTTLVFGDRLHRPHPGIGVDVFGVDVIGVGHAFARVGLFRGRGRDGRCLGDRGGRGDGCVSRDGRGLPLGRTSLGVLPDRDPEGEDDEAEDRGEPAVGVGPGLLDRLDVAFEGVGDPGALVDGHLGRVEGDGRVLARRHHLVDAVPARGGEGLMTAGAADVLRRGVAPAAGGGLEGDVEGRRALGHGLGRVLAQRRRVVRGVGDRREEEPGRAQALIGGDQRLGHLADVLVAVLWVLRQGLHHHGLDRRGDVCARRPLARRDRLLRELEGDRRHEGLAAEGDDAGEQLVDHHPEGVDVDAGVGDPVARQLRGHVLGGAEEGPRGGRLRDRLLPAKGRRLGHHLGDAEVEELDEVGIAAALDPEAVVRLHVAVDDALLVGGVEGPADLEDHPPQPRPGKPALLLDGRREVFALEQLHRQERLTLIGVAEVDDVDDVLVLDHRRGLRLTEESLGDVRRVAEIRAQDLDREAAMDRDVLGDVDRAHPALGDPFEDLVAVGEDRPDETKPRPRSADDNLNVLEIVHREVRHLIGRRARL